MPVSSPTHLSKEGALMMAFSRNLTRSGSWHTASTRTSSCSVKKACSKKVSIIIVLIAALICRNCRGMMPDPGSRSPHPGMSSNSIFTACAHHSAPSQCVAPSNSIFTPPVRTIGLSLSLSQRVAVQR
eukprot:1186480-Prorocentrum_minimum.AAC.1